MSIMSNYALTAGQERLSHGAPASTPDSVYASEARIARVQCSAALLRSASERLWQHVTPAGVSQAEGARLFLVPSQSRAEVEHVVGVKQARPGQPVWARFECTCEARRRYACAHRAAVYQYLVHRKTGLVPRSLKAPAPAPAQAPAQPQQPASPPPGEAAAEAVPAAVPPMPPLGTSTPFSRPPLASPVSLEPLWEPARPRTGVRRVALT